MTWGELKKAVDTAISRGEHRHRFRGDDTPIGIIDVSFRPSDGEKETRFEDVYCGVTEREQEDGSEINITNAMLFG